MPTRPRDRKVRELPDPREALKSGNLRAAQIGFAMEQMTEFRECLGMSSDGPAIGFGTTLWLLGDLWGATLVWANVCDLATKGRYSHSSSGTFQSGLLLWFASVWLKDSACEEATSERLESLHDKVDELFTKLLRRKRTIMGASFAASLAKFLRREADLSSVEAEYSDVPLRRERQATMAMFYAGVRAFEDGNVQE